MGNSIDTNTECRSDKFIVRYANSNDNTITDVSLLKRRVVFISLTGLYNSWNQCPSTILFSALCLMPLKRNWIYHPKKHMREIREKDEVFCLFDKDSRKKTQKFIELLKWKDSQGLVFWMLDNDEICDTNRTEDLISPNWRTLSDKLTTLYDPVTGCNYEPIKLDTDFWQNTYNKQRGYMSKYNTKPSSILMQLYGLSWSMKYKCIQEILYQSNPKSLNPVTSSHNLSDINTKQQLTPVSINGDNGWVMCEDY